MRCDSCRHPFGSAPDAGQDPPRGGRALSSFGFRADKGACAEQRALHGLGRLVVEVHHRRASSVRHAGRMAGTVVGGPDDSHQGRDLRVRLLRRQAGRPCAVRHRRACARSPLGCGEGQVRADARTASGRGAHRADRTAALRRRRPDREDGVLLSGRTFEGGARRRRSPQTTIRSGPSGMRPLRDGVSTTS